MFLLFQLAGHVDDDGSDGGSSQSSHHSSMVRSSSESKSGPDRKGVKSSAKSSDASSSEPTPSTSVVSSSGEARAAAYGDLDKFHNTLEKSVDVMKEANAINNNIAGSVAKMTGEMAADRRGVVNYITGQIETLGRYEWLQFQKNIMPIIFNFCAE